MIILLKNSKFLKKTIVKCVILFNNIEWSIVRVSYVINVFLLTITIGKKKDFFGFRWACSVYIYIYKYKIYSGFLGCDIGEGNRNKFWTLLFCGFFICAASLH